MPARVVAVSHTMGAGGGRVGRFVAERLGFRYVDEEIISMAAAKAGVVPELVADAERRRRLLDKVLEGLARGGTAAGSAAYAVPRDRQAEGTEDYRRLIIETIVETAHQGSVVIVAHAASIALADTADLLRVLVTAPSDVRAGRVAAAESIDRDQAAKMIRESDAARADYLKRFYRIDRELPTHYDVVLNTDRLEIAQAGEIVVSAALR
jgi:cytidylate kinase